MKVQIKLVINIIQEKKWYKEILWPDCLDNIDYSNLVFAQIFQATIGVSDVVITYM